MRIVIEAGDAEWQEIRCEVIKALILEAAKRFKTFSIAEVCGLLDITPKSLNELGIDKIDIFGNGSAMRILLADLEAKIEERRIKGLNAPPKRRRARSSARAA